MNPGIEKPRRVAFLPKMIRPLLFSACLFVSAALHAGPVPAELEKALAAFESEGAKNWGFTQTTTASGKSIVERYDPQKPEFSRWSLLEKNGRPPTEAEVAEYSKMLSRRSPGQSAPNVKNQIRPETCEPLGVEDGRARFRFQLKPGADDDKSAEHMVVTFSLHQESGAIERVELTNIRPFSPVFAVKVEEARTLITYTIPDGERPSLLRDIQLRVRGRAMVFKSLDEDMTVTYSDYVAPPKPAPRP